MVYEIRYMVGNWFVYEDGKALCMCSDKGKAERIKDSLEAIRQGEQ